ncbi:MAG: hypothetical protein ABIE70_04455 [bacterium]
MIGHIAATILLLACLMMGCSDGNSSSSPNNSPAAGLDGASLLGLQDNRNLNYLQTDTTSDDDLNITVSTRQRQIAVSGSGEDWVLSDGDERVANLKLNDGSITLNGFWLPGAAGGTISYFAVPPVLMARQLHMDQPWQGYTPEFFDGTTNQTYIFANTYFGFFFSKTFVGRELIQLPAGAFNAYRFDVELFRNFHDSLPAAQGREYYYPQVGLVQLNFRGGPTNRTLSLISYE